MEPPERPFALLATILANANRNPEENPEPFTVHDFIQWLSLPFEDVNDADEDEEDEEGWEEDPEVQDEPEPVINEAPDWMQWKRNIRAYAEAVDPTPSN